MLFRHPMVWFEYGSGDFTSICNQLSRTIQRFGACILNRRLRKVIGIAPRMRTRLFIAVLSSALTLTSSLLADTKTEMLKVVSIHVGGNDSKAGTYEYHAPHGFRVTDIQLRERSKGGDAQYNVISKGPDEVRVHWSVRSRTVKALGIVVNTITAFLDLDMEVSLDAVVSPPNSALPPSVKEETPSVDVISRMLQVLGRFSPLAFLGGILFTISVSIVFRWRTRRRDRTQSEEFEHVDKELKGLRRVSQYLGNVDISSKRKGD